MDQNDQSNVQSNNSNIVAATGAGSLYTTDFIPKFIDKGAAVFVLTADGIVHIYNSSGQIAMELPVSAINVTDTSSLFKLKVELSLNGTPYIFRVDPSASNPLSVAGGVLGMFATMNVGERTKAFFDAVLRFQSVTPESYQGTATSAGNPPLNGTEVKGEISPNNVPPSSPMSNFTPPVSSQAQPQPAPNINVRKTLRKRAIIYTLLGFTSTIWGGLAVIGTFLEASTADTTITSWAFLIGGVVLIVRGVLGFVKIRRL